jgi:hypothetical protein
MLVFFAIARHGDERITIRFRLSFTRIIRLFDTLVMAGATAPIST